MLAAAALIKPFAGLAALFLLLEGRWRPILYAIGFGIILLIAPAAVHAKRPLIEPAAEMREASDSATNAAITAIAIDSTTSPGLKVP